MTRQLKLLNEEKKVAAEKKLAFSRAKKFVEKAESLNLTGKNWARDRIHLDQSVTFLELEQLLNQCANSPDYYFNPTLLKISVPEKSSGNISTVNLKLRGTFLTRHN